MATATLDNRNDRATRLASLRAALESGTLRGAQRMINALHPAEIAHLLESLPPQQRELAWELVERELDGDVLIELSEEVRAELIDEMDTHEIVAAAEGLDLDDLADLLAELPEAVTRQVLKSMDQQDRVRLTAVLAYPEDTAGGRRWRERRRRRRSGWTERVKRRAEGCVPRLFHRQVRPRG